MNAPLVRIVDMHKAYPLPRTSLLAPPQRIRAVRGVTLDVTAGENLGIVGESGCGKSTLARLVMALEKPDRGHVQIAGRNLNALGEKELRRARRDFQMIFQDPYGSLDPRRTVARIVAEPLDLLPGLSRSEWSAHVTRAVTAVGLRADDLDKYPHEFSGGQRQRIAIARALVTRPKLIVADEAVSALDVSVQAQVLNLMAELQRQHGMTYLFISHNLAVIDHLCPRVAVMYLGRIVEIGTTASIFSRPAHPYTQALIAALPRAVPPPQGGTRRRSLLQGNPLSQTVSSSGCALAARCTYADARCRAETPPLRHVEEGRQAACHKAEEILARPFTGPAQ